MSMTPMEMMKEAAQYAGDVTRLQYRRNCVARTSVECFPHGIVINHKCRYRFSDGTPERVFAGHRAVPYSTLEFCKSNIMIDAIDVVEMEVWDAVEEFANAI